MNWGYYFFIELFFFFCRMHCLWWFWYPMDIHISEKNHGICYVNIKIVWKYFLEWHAVIFALIKILIYSKWNFASKEHVIEKIRIKSPITGVAVYALFSPHHLKLGRRDDTPHLNSHSVTWISVPLKLVVRFGGRGQRGGGYFSLPVFLLAMD